MTCSDQNDDFPYHSPQSLVWDQDSDNHPLAACPAPRAGLRTLSPGFVLRQSPPLTGGAAGWARRLGLYRPPGAGGAARVMHPATYASVDRGCSMAERLAGLWTSSRAPAPGGPCGSRRCRRPATPPRCCSSATAICANHPQRLRPMSFRVATYVDEKGGNGLAADRVMIGVPAPRMASRVRAHQPVRRQPQLALVVATTTCSRLLRPRRRDRRRRPAGVLGQSACAAARTATRSPIACWAFPCKPSLT